MEVKNRNDYLLRRIELSKLLGEDFTQAVLRLYAEEKMSCAEIAEKFSAMGWPIGVRSLQHIVEVRGILRTVGESFRLAVKKGRVHWHLKDASDLSRGPTLDLAAVKKTDIRNGGLKYKIFKRDGYRCVICGNTAKEMPLEIDHLIPRCKGGTDNEDNLRVLCHSCNEGKRIAESER